MKRIALIVLAAYAAGSPVFDSLRPDSLDATLQQVHRELNQEMLMASIELDVSMPARGAMTRLFDVVSLPAPLNGR